MTLTELRYLVALADQRHFGRAAEFCNVSQPTLSTQIRKLEDELGIALFERGNRSVVPTPVGERVIAEARQVLNGASRLRDIAGAARSLLAGPLSLGIIPTLSPYLLPWLLSPLRAMFPALELNLVEDQTAVLLRALSDYDLDAALLALPVDAPDAEQQPLFDEAFYLACPADHPLAHRDRVRMTEIETASLMLLSEGHCLRDQAIALCSQPSIDPGFRTASLTTLRHLVAAGYGCTLLPALAGAAETDARITLVPLAEDNARRRIGLVWRRGSPRRNDFDALAALIRQQAPDQVSVVPAN
jgi:LysR family hydrogen peroxide-inducible transcriptional activator